VANITKQVQALAIPVAIIGAIALFFKPVAKWVAEKLDAARAG
jgi:hypothetical protein